MSRRGFEPLTVTLRGYCSTVELAAHVNILYQNLTLKLQVWHPKARMLEEPLKFWRDITLIAAFFILAPITLGLSIFSLINLGTPSAAASSVPGSTSTVLRPGVQVYASLPTNFPTISGQITVADARVEIVRQYLASYNSPLLPYAEKLVQEADKNELDFRLLAAIAQKESNLCKIIPYGSYNCWGWGITSVSSLAFKSFDAGIETVSHGLKENYVDEGLMTPEEIMTKYNPGSPNGEWAKGVRQFMSEME